MPSMRFVAFQVCSSAGATADAFTLFDELEMKLEAHQGALLQLQASLALP